jgi:DNA invertase Pin-like site-specific DNA recombinase
MSRAVAYMRLDEGRPGNPGKEAQRVAIQTWAERAGVEVTAWAVDVGIDAATPIAERPGLVAAYRALVDHGAGMLVAANADRFGQDELVCGLIERAALTQGATVHTADGSRGPVRARTDDPEASAAWTRGAIDLARAFERVTFRARIRASLAERRARGQRIGTVPYGFRLAADGVHIEPDETEQSVVDAVRSLSASGLSQRAIVTRLAERGVSGRTGAPLRQTQVAKILRAS